MPLRLPHKQELNITPKPTKNKTKEALKATQAKEEKKAKKAKEAEEAKKAKMAKKAKSLTLRLITELCY